MGVEKAPCDDMAVKRESEADESGAKVGTDKRRHTPRGQQFTRGKRSMDARVHGLLAP